jgi:hypothetical protein
MDHHTRPAVAHHLTGHRVAEHRAVERAGVVDYQNASFAGLRDDLPDQGDLAPAGDVSYPALEGTPAAPAEEVRSAGLCVVVARRRDRLS